MKKAQYEKFGARIADLMAREDLSQRAMAERLHIAQATVSHWVNGRKYPDFWNIAEICAQFDVTADWVIKGVE